jgi:hypothetical protein
VEDQRYFAFEVNYDGVALTNHAQFGNRFDFSWGGPDVCVFNIFAECPLGFKPGTG